MNEDDEEDDVRYGIADCRKRLRDQRVTLRTHHPPTDVPTTPINYEQHGREEAALA
jgi:hypothetical protein